MDPPRTDAGVDDVLRTLLLPFEEALLPRLEGVRVLMLNAQASPVLPAQARDWRLQQDFRPFVDALADAGLEATPELPAGEFDVVLVPAPRQRQHGRALLAQAWARLAKGGVLLACAGNGAGGRSLQADLEKSGMQFNKVDPEPFRQALVKAEFYKEWQGKYGPEAWAILEKVTTKLG